MTWLKKYFTFKGRINRSMYIKYLAIPWVCIIAGSIGTEAIKDDFKWVFGVLIGLSYLAVIVLGWCCSTRRVHDYNKSGGRAWLSIIPIIGLYWAGEMLFRKGTEGPNDYGPEPNSIHVSNTEEE